MMNSSRRKSRPGTTLLLVVLCLILVTSMMGTMLRQFNLANRQASQLAQQAQATLLAQSGIERALSAWQRNSDYSGEVWRITAEELGSKHTAEVDLKIEQGTNKSLQISCTATYPLESERRSEIRKLVTVGTKE